MFVYTGPLFNGRLVQVTLYMEHNLLSWEPQCNIQPRYMHGTNRMYMLVQYIANRN